MADKPTDPIELADQAEQYARDERVYKFDPERPPHMMIDALASALRELHAENERLRAELEHVKESARMGLAKWNEMVAVVPGWFESAAQGFDEEKS